MQKLKLSRGPEILRLYLLCIMVNDIKISIINIDYMCDVCVVTLVTATCA